MKPLWETAKKLFITLVELAVIYCRIGWQYLKRFSLIAYRYSLVIAKKTGVQLKHFFNILKKHWPFIQSRLWQYIVLTRLNRPIGIFLLLWPAFWALWISADGAPDLAILIIFILGVVLMRSAGCVINDLADRDLDRFVRRTQARVITTGEVNPEEAAILAAVLVFFAFILVLFLNDLTIKLSGIALFLAIIYPYMKRYTYLPQLFLGLAFGMAIPMAFAAQTGSLPPIAWLLLLTTVLWAMVYDTMYAMVDREDDIRAGIRSTAILFEDADKTIIGIIQILVLIALVIIGNQQGFGWLYYNGLIAGTLFFTYQQYLIKDRIPERCFRAFLNNNWFGAVVFAGIYLHYQFN